MDYNHRWQFEKQVRKTSDTERQLYWATLKINKNRKTVVIPGIRNKIDHWDFYLQKQIIKSILKKIQKYQI